MSPTDSTANAIWYVPIGGDRKPQLVFDSAARNLVSAAHAALSPDGRWLAHIAYPAGRIQVFVQPFPTTGAMYQTSNDGGDEPVWSPDGRELFYWQQGTAKLVAVRVLTQPSFSFSVVRDFPSIGPLSESSAPRNYDISPDGRRFIVKPRPPAQPAPPSQIHVVLNWFTELQQRVPVK